MPELPEVEHGRRLADSVAGGRRIVRVEVADDPIVFEGVPPAALREALTGRRVRAVHRYGKHLWFELDAPPFPLFHFGMTGAFRTPTARPLELESRAGRGDATWPPKFTKIHLVFDDGGELVMTNARRLGRIRLRFDPLREAPLSGLGFDPLTSLPSKADFKERARARKVPIKALLLDQGFAAGVGNWIADEVLYQARLDPRRVAATLSDTELLRVRTVLARVVRTAVEVNAEKSKYPRGWLFHRRWGKQAGVTTPDGHVIEHLEVGGRTTAWVPALQR